LKLGGFPELPIMEDLEMVKRIKRLGRIRIATQSVRTSSRRWKELGPLKTTFYNQIALAGYLSGVAPEKIARFYISKIGSRE
jgi:hypothetical protein